MVIEKGDVIYLLLFGGIFGGSTGFMIGWVVGFNWGG